MKIIQVTFQYIQEGRVIRITEPFDKTSDPEFFRAIEKRKDDLKKSLNKQVNYYY